VILVKSETSKAKPLTVGDAGMALGDSIIINHTAGARFRNIPMEQGAERRRREQRNLI
jgi:hypothetical protein